jgi:hypothetical protein
LQLVEFERHKAPLSNNTEGQVKRQMAEGKAKCVPSAHVSPDHESRSFVDKSFFPSQTIDIG